MVINNVKVYGLEESIKRAKYPMSTDISKLNSMLPMLEMFGFIRKLPGDNYKLEV